MESYDQNPAPIISEIPQTNNTPTPEPSKDNNKVLFLCEKCQSHIPYITNLEISDECVITGWCPCGYFFIQELFSFMKAVYSIPQKNKEHLTFPQYYQCKKHGKNLNSICKECEILICDDCIKEDHHTKEPLKKGTIIKKNEYYKIRRNILELINKLKKKFPIIEKDKNLNDSYRFIFLKKILGQYKLINSLLYTYSFYKDNEQIENNMYYVSCLSPLNFKEVIEKITEDNLNSFLNLASIIDPFEKVSKFVFTYRFLFESQTKMIL